MYKIPEPKSKKEEKNPLEMWSGVDLETENRFLYPQREVGKAGKRVVEGEETMSYIHLYVEASRQTSAPCITIWLVHRFFNRIQPQIATMYMNSKYKIIKAKKKKTFI